MLALLMNSGGSRDGAPKRIVTKKRCIDSTVLLASLILLACRVSADEDAVITRAGPTGTPSIDEDDSHTVASSTSSVDRRASTEANNQDLARSTFELISSTVESTTKLDAEWSAESFESGEATPSTSSQRTTTEAAAPSTQSKSTVTSWPAKSRPWPWMVFVLSGNSTVAARRQRDLGTYLRLNLAARLDADYNDVAINRILLTGQSVLANISVEPSHLAAPGLDALGQGNVTLLELSGNEFQVERIIRFDGAPDQREMMNLEMASMVSAVGSEVTVYGAVGAVFLFLLVALLLGLSFNSPCRNENGAKYLSGNNFDRDQTDAGGQELLELRSVSTPASGGEPALPSCAPPVIYSEQLAREMCDSASLLPGARFMPAWSPGDSGAAPPQLHRYQPDRRRRAKQDQPDRHCSPPRC